MRIFLLGFMGTGKTYWGKQLAAALQWPYFDLDEMICGLEKQTVAEIFDTKGEEYFRQQEHTLLKQLIRPNRNMILSCGGGTPCFFNNMQLMQEAGKTVYLQSTIETLHQRLKLEADERPLLQGHSPEQLTDYITSKLQERQEIYEQAQITIDTEELTLEELKNKTIHV